MLILLLALAQAEPIRLDADNLINLSGQKAAVALVDEPGVDAPKSAYTNGYIKRELHYPIRIVVDLKAPHALTQVSLYDGSGKGRVRVHAGPPAKWRHLFDDPLDGYRRWNRHPVAVTARYLQLTFEDPGGVVGELVLHGTAEGKPEPPPRPGPRPRGVTMDVFIGLNGFNNDPVERLAAGGQLREYHSWVWDDGNMNQTAPAFPKNTFAWNPSGVSGKGWGWNFDAFYRKARGAGIEVVPVVQGSPGWMKEHKGDRLKEKPVAPGRDPEDPASYAAHADYLFQFAARYGSTKVDDALLKLREGQPRVSGLGLIRYLENWNEPDRTWDGRAAHFKPFELAAMSSADIDGHRGALGKTVGVRNADPKMKFVLAGLAFPEIEYLKALKFWADVNRGGDFPADVLNLHHYSNDAGGQGGGAKHGVSPEADGLRKKMKRYVDWRDRNLPGRELWLSEFGYDTHPESPQSVPAIGPNDREEVQGQWLVRAYLELAAAGIDRAQMFMLRDVDPSSGFVYATSGLTRGIKQKHRPKKAWFYVSGMRRILRKTRFAAEVDSGNPGVRIYRFDGDGRSVFAAWCPTSKALRVPDFALPVAAEGAERFDLEAGHPEGRKGVLEIRNGRPRFEVTERPTFIVVPKR